jgi:hypothetical protein
MPWRIVRDDHHLTLVEFNQHGTPVAVGDQVMEGWSTLKVDVVSSQNLKGVIHVKCRVQYFTHHA